MGAELETEFERELNEKLTVPISSTPVTNSPIRVSRHVRVFHGSDYHTRQIVTFDPEQDELTLEHAGVKMQMTYENWEMMVKMVKQIEAHQQLKNILNDRMTE